jgi:hypothetical protein
MLNRFKYTGLRFRPWYTNLRIFCRAGFRIQVYALGDLLRRLANDASCRIVEALVLT